MITQAEILVFQTEREQKIMAVASPVGEPLKVSAWLAEEFKLHLLKLSDTENEISGSDLVSERLSYLSNAKRDFFSCSPLNVGEVYENTLCCLRTEIKLRFAVLGNA